MDTSNKRESAKDESTAADADPAAPAGLDAGGHEPAPESEDPGLDEARDSIQDAFDHLQAMHPDEKVWDEAARRAEAEPAPSETSAEKPEAAPEP
jgi:hypothetical protein